MSAVRVLSLLTRLPRVSLSPAVPGAFHLKCIVRWLSQSQNKGCPMCREPIDMAAPAPPQPPPDPQEEDDETTTTEEDGDEDAGADETTTIIDEDEEDTTENGEDRRRIIQ